jgi:hypothetical protein
MAVHFRSPLLPRLLDLALITILCAGFIVELRIGLRPSNPTAGVAVIYAPWTRTDETMARAVAAGARFVRFGGFEFIAIVIPEVPDYVDRVLAGSALITVDPEALAACLPVSSSSKGKVL